jgi:hypothetical protein
MAFALIVFLATPLPLLAEDVCVKYHKCVSLDQFKCSDITRSSFINRLCYAEANAPARGGLLRSSSPPALPTHSE